MRFLSRCCSNCIAFCIRHSVTCHALAKAFARKGIEVSVGTTRDPKSFAADAAAIAPTSIPKTLLEAAKADIVLFAANARSQAPYGRLIRFGRSRGRG